MSSPSYLTVRESEWVKFRGEEYKRPISNDFNHPFRPLLQLTIRHWTKRGLTWDLPSCSDRGATEVYPTEDGRKLSPTRSQLSAEEPMLTLCYFKPSLFIHARCLPMPTLHSSVEIVPLPRVLRLQGAFYDIAESHNRHCMMRDTGPPVPLIGSRIVPCLFCGFCCWNGYQSRG
jgi:hypothetical protein